MPNSHCPACGGKAIAPFGHSELLIVGSEPDQEDLVRGRPFAVNYQYDNGAKVLKKEFERIGMQLSDFKLSLLWLHEPNKSENCWQAGYDNILEVAKGKKAILLIGAGAVETFTGQKVSDVSGLKVTSPVLSAPLIVAMVNPSMALGRGFGEVRFAVQKWGLYLQQENLYG